MNTTITISRARGVRKACLAALWLAALLLTGCGGEAERSARLYVFGTLVEVKFWGVPQAEADAALADLQQLFNRMHRDWHAWEPGLLTEANSAFARGEPATVDDWIVHLVQRSQALEAASGGRFNPAIGGIIGLWGFHTSEYPVIGPPPSAEAIEGWLERAPSTRDIEIDGHTLRSGNPAVQLDFGGVAKGYAVDLAIEHLRSRGIENAIVNAGGDLRAMGRHGKRPWRVAVRRPGGGVVGAIEISGDESLFTSGNYERFREDAEARYPHIIDPRSGWPVSDVASATVVTTDGLMADAAATALIVAGLGEWPEVARDLRLLQVLIVDGEGQVYMTPDMSERVHLVEDQPVTVIDPFD